MRVDPQERVLAVTAIGQREGSVLTSRGVADGEAPVTDAGVAEGEDEEAVAAGLEKGAVMKTGGVVCKSSDGMELVGGGEPIELRLAKPATSLIPSVTHI